MENLGKPKGVLTKLIKNQPPLKDMEVDMEESYGVKKGYTEEVNQEWAKDIEGFQGDKRFIPSTNSYKSMDSINEKALMILWYQKKDIRAISQSDRKSALGAQLG